MLDVTESLDQSRCSTASPLQHQLAISPALARNALQRAFGSLSFVFQPIVCISDGITFAHEALLRCDGDVAGLYSLNVLAQTFQVDSALRRHLTTGLCDVLTERQTGVLFVNINADQLRELPDLFAMAPLRQRIDSIVIELHEDIDAQQLRASLPDLISLRHCGLRLAFDDFGVGQARLLELESLAPEFVKLDGHMVRGADRCLRKRRLLAATIALCREFQTKVIAEGVETADELKLLSDLECPFAQGFVFGREWDDQRHLAPMPCRINPSPRTDVLGFATPH